MLAEVCADEKPFALAVSTSVYTMALDSAPFTVSENNQFFRLCSTEHKRKNRLFSDTTKGADSSAIVYTLVETAKANGIDPYAYLLRVLSLLPYFGKSPSNEELDQLLPWHQRMRESLLFKDNSI